MLKYSMKSANKYLQMIYKLEKELGRYAKFIPLESIPKGINFMGIAKEIQSFIGYNKPLLVCARTQEKDIGGKNEKGQEMDYIEIDPSYTYNHNAACAVIAHEVMHSFLNDHLIRELNQEDNEILTDVATIYMGLGKIVIRGCQTEKKETVFINYSPAERVTKTQCGYLDKKSYAFIYLVLCNLRKTPKEVQEKGLRAADCEVLAEVRRSRPYKKFLRRSKESYFKRTIRKQESIQHRLNERIVLNHLKLEEMQTKVKEYQQLLTSIEDNVKTQEKKISDYNKNIEYNPIMVTLKSYYFADELKTTISQTVKKSRKDLKALNAKEKRDIIKLVVR